MPSNRRTFIKHLGLGAAGIGCLPILPGCASRQMSFSGQLPRSTPEQQGVSSQSILDFLDAIAKSKHEFHSFMMARHGQVIAEGWWTPYRASAKHMLYSLSKSFTSTAVGFAVTEGRLTVDDPVVAFFPHDLPDIEKFSANLGALKVKHLLTMSVGRAKDSMPVIAHTQNWARAFLAAPIEHEPGSVFLYDSGATYMLSAIVQHVTGQRVIDYLRPRLFHPLGIHGETWEVSPQGVNTGGWGLSVTTEALVKFGQLYLQNGEWNGRQILPASWVHEATTFKIQQPGGTPDWHQGYCYQFWRCQHNAFRGDGAYGQFMIVMPDEEAVVAITCQTSDMQGEINLVWDHLLPGMKSGSLPADDSTHTQLQQRLGQLQLPLAQGRPDSDATTRISRKTFKLDSNEAGFESVSFEFESENFVAIYLTESHGRHGVKCGLGKSIDGTCAVPGTPPRLTVGELLPCKVAASAGWTDTNTLEMLWRYYETPHHDTVICHFEGDSVSIEFKRGIPGQKETRPVLRGRLM